MNASFSDGIKDQLSPERIKEIQDAMDKLKMNKDVDSIISLMANFANATDIDGKLNILEDLDYFMHQIDNARDFVSLGGLTRIILPGLKSDSAKVSAKTAILLGSSAQANTQVQVMLISKMAVKKHQN